VPSAGENVDLVVRRGLIVFSLGLDDLALQYAIVR